MRSPSARCLTNRVAIYRYAPAQDADAGVAANPYGAAVASSVPCSVQPDDPERFVDEATGRLVEKTVYKVFFVTDYSLRPNDKIAWVDSVGVTRNLYVLGTSDLAGKGVVFSARCEERL